MKNPPSVMIRLAEKTDLEFIVRTERIEGYEELTARWTIEVHRPVQTQVLAWVAQHGQEAITQSVALRQDCCRVRKIEPLERALQGQSAWITGLRREQSSARAAVELIDASHDQ